MSIAPEEQGEVVSDQQISHVEEMEDEVNYEEEIENAQEIEKVLGRRSSTTH